MLSLTMTIFRIVINDGYDDDCADDGDHGVVILIAITIITIVITKIIITTIIIMVIIKVDVMVTIANSTTTRHNYIYYSKY